MLSTMKPHELRLPVLVAGAVALAGLLAYLLLRPPATIEAPVPQTAVPQAPSAPPAPPSAPAAPPPSAEGLRLHGLLGGGAIIAAADGRQRFVAIGREVAPGLRSRRIEQNHVIPLPSPGGKAAAWASKGLPGPAGIRRAGGDRRIGVGRGTARRDPRYRLGLAPRQAGGRTTGFVVRPNVQHAGARAGRPAPGRRHCRRQWQRLRRGTDARARLADRQFHTHRIRGRARRQANSSGYRELSRDRRASRDQRRGPSALARHPTRSRIRPAARIGTSK